MKIKVICVVATLFLTMSAVAQVLDMPSMGGFQSTSSMVGSGSTLPQAATSGAVMADEYNPGRAAGPRRVETNPSNPFGGQTTGDGGPKEPGSPIGAMPWMLMLVLAGAYAGVTAYRRRRAEV